MSKPVHPAAVHFPIAFLSLAYSLDILSTLRLPALAAYLPTPTESSRLSTYLLALGLASAIPAVLTGGQQALLMISKGGLKDESGSLRPKVKATFTHAILSDIMLAVTTYVWWAKHNGESAAWIVPVEGLLLASMLVVGGTGGTLTYNYGVGMSIGKVAKKEL
ncbi:uncharacterized protein RCC_07985 [Ramularia collo-cygni]|uniref:DUF2231 domain-containing protein n=1 Tax=Ramularia collo-cygni TaxID=112498 RepID=A0A2D3VE48_9PEZI|nr:uncharacterized protein RCC_07985 [Ramularia collo-cygni]CZT22116.1 uncharacterized protein RCC_07985 [Ramularia collo-cygni]